MGETFFLRLIATVCITSSIAGVLLSTFLWDWSHGGRGGAIAVGLALLTLFATRNNARGVYGALTDETEGLKAVIDDFLGSDSDADNPIRGADYKLKKLDDLLKQEAQRQEAQNRYLAIATGVGTLFWGFGDLFAFWLRILFYGM